MGVYIWEEKLPSAYQEVEWIGSSRTQVINTGVIPTTQTYTAELEVESIKSGSEYWAFGIWGTTGFRGGQDSSGHWDTSYGASYEPSSYNLNTKTKITISNNGKGTSTDTAIGLFGMGESGDYANNRKGAYKIYYCKILNNGTLIRDFVPCYRKSDDEIGMYDLVNNQFYTNSGSGTFTKGQDINYVEHELQNAYIGEYIENWATQGPCQDGFHVPLNTEWQAVYDIRTALGGGSSDGTNFGIALKLPFAGRRLYSSADVGNQDTNGYYWSSSRYSANDAYSLYFYPSDIYPQINSRRASGFSVRCFKNSPVVPTSSWTKLYGTSIESGGIFWSSEDGLISLSSDGQTWITIQDKNLGATTVWNSGDTLSETNAGKYYQRGNNYGFPRTGSVTTSSTRVNASTYGPGNYYSSSKFITYAGRWDTTDNGNLRGGVDGNVPVD